MCHGFVEPNTSNSNRNCLSGCADGRQKMQDDRQFLDVAKGIVRNERSKSVIEAWTAPADLNVQRITAGTNVEKMLLEGDLDVTSLQTVVTDATLCAIREDTFVRREYALRVGLDETV
jgi:hypothetical protein